VANEAIRRFPLVPVTVLQLESLLSPLLGGRGLRTVEQLDGGLTNTILRVSPEDGSRALLVRIFPGGRVPWEREQKALARVAPSLPVPNLLLADDRRLPYPSLVFHWIEGITLNSLRKQASASELLSLAKPLGRLLARVASVPSGSDGGLGADGSTPVSSAEALFSVSEQRLLCGRARSRLGEQLAHAIWLRLSKEMERFRTLGLTDCLVHGDFGGRNILVAPDDAHGWRITGLIDWEEAFAGWALWDVGSLFRYPNRYGDAFRGEFERRYRSVRGMPEDWYSTARLLDATRQLETLDSERERPAAFADCRQLLELVIQDDG
jgi:aminoglycoside phosphotransferase (APT) family kinase protein